MIGVVSTAVDAGAVFLLVLGIALVARGAMYTFLDELTVGTAFVAIALYIL